MQATFLYPHLLFEALAYFVGFRLFIRQRALQQRCATLATDDDGFWLAVGAILGAAVGSKLGAWLQDPTSAFSNFPDPIALMQGKTVVGGFLGGLIGVELSKKMTGVRQSTGDMFAVPCLAGIITGRIGCFLSGLADRTHGTPTSLPWAHDFGDGILRHPTQIYEILFAVLLWIVIVRYPNWFRIPGDQFRFFMIAYLSFRLAIDGIKPVPHVYPGGFSGIQIACISGLVYYAKNGLRIGKTRLWDEE